MFRARAFRDFDERGLRIVLIVLFFAVSLPTLVLIRHVYAQLATEAAQQHRQMAEAFAARVDARLLNLLAEEEARSFADYGFLVVAGDPGANFLQRSPLSAFPPTSALPGLIAYFQVDAEGAVSTPLIPQPDVDHEKYGVTEMEFAQRRQRMEKMVEVLSRNRLIPRTRARQDSLAAERDADRESKPDAAGAALSDQALRSSSSADDAIQAPAQAQTAFDRLSENRQGSDKKAYAAAEPHIQELQKSAPAAPRPQANLGLASTAPPQAARVKRKEQAYLPELAGKAASLEREESGRRAVPLRISTFESEIDPFEFSLIDSDHIVLYRKVWRERSRYIQGALIDSPAFLNAVIGQEFEQSAFAPAGLLRITYRDEKLAEMSGSAEVSAAGDGGEFQYHARLAPPYSDLELNLNLANLPSAPGATLVHAMALTLLAVLCGGFLLMYRLGLGQIRLARQQQDFVSAVGHELKTPLTSIRMYSELLRAGWVNEEKRKTYYDYIHTESERLSRLITNVLQLARLTRSGPALTTQALRVGELLSLAESKVQSEVQRADFALQVTCAEPARNAMVHADPDAMAQVFINLIDNALKFSARSEVRHIDLGATLRGDTVQFTVRDYGPGIPKAHLKKIFGLFYRAESELTRETIGTGIGLALVHQMVTAMQGKVDVRNCEPGAEFTVTLPLAP